MGASLKAPKGREAYNATILSGLLRTSWQKERRTELRS